MIPLLEKLVGLKNKLFKRVKKTYVVKPPTGALDLFDLIDKGLQRQYAEIEAEKVKLQRELERLKKEREFDEYQEIKELADRYFKKLKKEERLRTLKLEIVGDFYPVWFLKNDYVYKKLHLKGFCLYQTPHGYLLWYPWLIDDEGKSFIPIKGATSFSHLFRGNNPVTQIKGGKFDSNYVYDGLNLYLIPDRQIDAEDGREVNIIHLADQERQQYEIMIERYKEELSRLYSELQKIREKEVDYQKEIEDLRIAKNTQMKAIDSYRGSLEIMAEKLASMSDNLANSLTTIQDMRINQLIAESSVVTLKNAIKGLRTEIAEVLRDIDSPLYRKVDERFKQILSTIERLTPSPAPKKK
ncbi:MAG TPA: hypothetical protein ENF58_02095 [Candidatus Altiarchaeales archaeon]|nr:hypothetical protein [Candidatus Altiarchaeales archaeon]